jgi:hypothetical protein
MTESVNCSKNQILRRGSVRKSYRRKSYKRLNGTTVPAVNIGPSRMASTCIKDIGNKGHGPYILPKLNPKVSLSKFGYSLNKSAIVRKKSLKKASKKYGTLEVLRRTNLIRNYTKSVPDNYKKLSADVEYMKNIYAKEKLNKNK